MKIADKTVIRSLGLAGCGSTANTASVDILDGRVVRIRPFHYDTSFTVDELRPWKLEKDGHVLDEGLKSLLPAYSIAYKKRMYSPNRVPTPLKRVDWDPNGERNPQNRGKSQFEPISWDEAIDIVATEIDRMVRTYGSRSILCQGDGHGEGKVYAGGHGCHTNMLKYVGDGATTQARQADSWEGWFWGAKHVWGMDPVGQQYWVNNVIKDIGENGDAVLFWGCDAETTPWGWGGLMASRICYWFNDIGVRSIYICPDVNYASGNHCDKWFPVLPNTDAALQLAIAYVWMTEGTYEKDYIDTHVIGYDWFEYYVLGNEDGIPKTPAWAAEKCGVPEHQIKALARYWAKHAVSIAHGNGGSYIRSCFCHEPGRLEVYLLGMQGLGKPGANQFKFIEWSMFALDTLNPLPVPEKLPSVYAAYHGWEFNTGVSFIPKTLIPDAILNPPVTWYGHTIATSPAQDQFRHFQFPMKDESVLHMIWSDSPCWSTCWNGGNKFQDALCHESIETVVIQHPWMENDCYFADIILPVSTTFECEDVANDICSGQFPLYFLEEYAVDPYVDSRTDHQIVCDVAEKLAEISDDYKDVRSSYAETCSYEEQMKITFEQSGIENFTYEDLLERGYWAGPTAEDWEERPHGMINFYNDPENNPLTTPSGKLEFYSTALAYYFPDDKERGPVAHWIEESDKHQERISSDRAKDYPFLLVSNHPHWRIHANCDDISWLREIDTCKIVGPDGYSYEPLWINPIDAEKLGIEHGDIVRMYNERGSVLCGAYLTERIMPGALSQDHGARVDSIVNGTGGLDRGGANNLIAPSATSSTNCAGEVTSGFLVGIEKADVAALAKQYPEEFGRTYDPATGVVYNSRVVDGGAR